MLVVLLLHIFITLACLWTGFLFYRFIFRNGPVRHLVFYAITGLLLLTLITQLAALFIPVGFYSLVMIFILLLMAGFLFRAQFSFFCTLVADQVKSVSLNARIFYTVLWLIILLINAGPTLMDDTESYHIQSIKWIQEFGSVPGIANLHNRFGFNSSWFSSVALFSAAPGVFHVYTVLNGVLSAWFCFYLVSLTGQKSSAPETRTAFGLLITLVFSLTIWPLIRGNAATANYDFITTLVVFILFSDSFINKNSGNYFLKNPEWIIWPVWLFTIRIINYPLLLLTLFAFYHLIKNRNWKYIGFTLLYGLLMLLPFLTRNIILSGYPFYPSVYFNWFNVDWKTDPEMVRNLVEYIKYYNRVSTAYLDIAQTKALGTRWIPSWFHYLFFHDKLILLAGMAGMITGFVRLLRNNRTVHPGYRFFFLVMLLYILSWFLVSPDPRFIYGILLAGVMLLFVYGSDSISRKWPARAISFLFVLLTVASGVYLARKIINDPGQLYLVSPAPLAKPTYVQSIVDGIPVNIPDKINNNWNARCFGTPLPCAYEIDSRLQARGYTVQDGFRLKK